MLSLSAKVDGNHCLLEGCLVHSSCSEDITEQVANDSPDMLSDARQHMAIQPALLEDPVSWVLEAAHALSVNQGDGLQ